MHDIIAIEEKGQHLAITWREQPSPFAVGVCRQAWATGTVEHTVIDGNYYVHRMAQLVSQTVLDVMKAGEVKHGVTWLTRHDTEDLAHAKRHLELLEAGDSSEPHLEHAITRLSLVLARRTEQSTKGRAS